LDGAYAFNKNVYGICVDETKGYTKEFVLGWFNSKAVDFYYKKKFSTKKDGAFPEIQTYLYEQLPIPPASPAEKYKVSELVNCALATKEADANADITSIEKEIDLIVYRLYKLDYDDVLRIDPQFEIEKDVYNNYQIV
jgi:hypothetical protein